MELKLGLAHGLRKGVGQVVRGGYAMEVDQAQQLLIPPEVEVLGTV